MFKKKNPNIYLVYWNHGIIQASLDNHCWLFDSSISIHSVMPVG